MKETKIYKTCREEKSLEEFYVDRAMRDRRGSSCKKCMLKWQHEYNVKRFEEASEAELLAYRDYRTNYDLQRDYNITLENYKDMLTGQGGGCAICNKTPEQEGRRLAVDHDHESGEIRGILCNTCNRALGLLQDNSDLLKRAARYLEKGEGRNIVTLYVKRRFAAAHSLPDYPGPCAKLHGHTWLIEAWFEKKPDPETGIAIDFREIKDVIDKYDHSFLNDLLPGGIPPTAENLAIVLRDELPKRCVKIRVWESEDCYAEVQSE